MEKNELEVIHYPTKSVSVEMTLPGFLNGFTGEHFYKLFRVETEMGVAIFNNEADALLFEQMKKLLSAAEKIVSGEKNDN
jgi:hypothetical protein